MGYRVRLQKVTAATNRSFHVTLPVVLVEALDLKKGEPFEWTVEDKNTLILRRCQPQPRRVPPGDPAAASPPSASTAT